MDSLNRWIRVKSEKIHEFREVIGMPKTSITLDIIIELIKFNQQILPW